MSELKLLPCPFCGGEATIDNAGGKYQAWCKHCCCIHMGEFYNTEAEAIAAWNRRADHIRDTTKKVSNADRIRGMSDEEWAAIIAADFTEEKLNYCQNKPECSAILETADGIISDEWCIQCALDWLTAETEGTE